MATRIKTQDSHLTIGGLLFVIAGIALCFSVVPHLPRIGSITPSLAPFFAVLLMFGWAMIAIRRGARRIWWIGFVLSGTMYLCAACLLGDPLLQEVAEALRPIYREARGVVPWYVIEACSMVSGLLFLVVSLFGVGAFGGLTARTLVQRHPRFKRFIF